MLALLVNQAAQKGKRMEGIKEFARQLLTTPAFYPAVLALVHAVLFYFVPSFPREIVTAADALIAVVASVLTGQQVSATRRAARLARVYGFKP